MRFTIRLGPGPGERLADAEAESLLPRLRQELVDLGARDIERVTAGAAPPGTRTDVAATFQLAAIVLGTAGTVVQPVDVAEAGQRFHLAEAVAGGAGGGQGLVVQGFGVVVAAAGA